jgi:hypothetical protein
LKISIFGSPPFIRGILNGLCEFVQAPAAHFAPGTPLYSRHTPLLG